MTTDDVGWDDPDRAVQIEDDDPETLAGEEVEFDEAAEGEPAGDDDEGPELVTGVADLPDPPGGQ